MLPRSVKPCLAPRYARPSGNPGYEDQECMPIITKNRLPVFEYYHYPKTLSSPDRYKHAAKGTARLSALSGTMASSPPCDLMAIQRWISKDHDGHLIMGFGRPSSRPKYPT